MKNIPLISSIIFFLIGSLIVTIELFEELQKTAWVKTELYFSVFVNIIFIVLISRFFYKYLISKDNILKYVMTTSILISLALYYYASLSYDPSFPTLAGMNLITVLYLIPGLLLIRGLMILIRKMNPQKSNLS